LQVESLSGNEAKAQGHLLWKVTDAIIRLRNQESHDFDYVGNLEENFNVIRKSIPKLKDTLGESSLEVLQARYRLAIFALALNNQDVLGDLVALLSSPDQEVSNYSLSLLEELAIRLYSFERYQFASQLLTASCLMREKIYGYWESAPKERVDHQCKSLNMLAGCQLKMNMLTDCEQTLETCFALRVKYFGEDDPSLAPLYLNYGVYNLTINKDQDAQSFLEKSIRLYDAQDTPNKQSDLAEASACFYLSQALYRAKNIEAASNNMKRCLDLRRKHVHGDHVDIAVALQELSLLFLLLKKKDESLISIREAVSMMERIFHGRQNPLTLECLQKYVHILTSLGMFKEALESLEKIVEVAEAQLPASQRKLVLNQYASLLFQQKRFEEAKAISQQLLTL